MQDLRQSEINLFIEMIKCSIDGCGKNRIIKSRNSPLKFSIAHNLIPKRPSQINRSQSSIRNDLTFDKDKAERRQKSFYQVYNEDVIRKFKEHKNKSQMRISRYRPASISEINNIKLKSFQFTPLVSEQQITKCFRSDEFSPIRKEKNRKKQRQMGKVKEKEREKDKEMNQKSDSLQRQMMSKICYYKQQTDCVEGKKKEMSQRFQSRFISRNQQCENEEVFELQPYTKFKVRYPKYRLAATKTPEPIKSNTSYIELNFKRKKEQTEIDAWATNDDY